MKLNFNTQYRIVKDSYCGYEVQYRRWWFPFWVQHGFTNTHISVEKAREYIDGIVDCVVENYNPHIKND